jgi:hydroxylamine reductase
VILITPEPVLPPHNENRYRDDTQEVHSKNEKDKEALFMFCYQCEQTAIGGCKVVGVCGKNEDLASIQDTIIFALKGIAAYATHARELGYTDPEVDAITHEALYFTLTNVNFNLQEHIDMAMKVGSAAIKVMDLLDRAHTERFGIPQPITVSQNKIEGKCIA